MALKYQRGTVVICSQVPDPNGVNPKNRPIVLVRDFDDTEPHAYGVAITGEFDYPLPASSIFAPYIPVLVTAIPDSEKNPWLCAIGLSAQPRKKFSLELDSSPVFNSQRSFNM